MKHFSYIFFICSIFLFIGSITRLPQKEIFLLTPQLIAYDIDASSNESISIVLFGDSGTGLKPQYDVANGIKTICEKHNCKSAFILGDVIYDVGVFSANDSQFNSKFEEPYKDINLPFYIAYGNHDYIGCESCYLEYSKISGKFNMPAKYYKVSYALLSVYVIDTENFDEAQQLWLTNELLADQKNTKVVVGHRPVLTYESVHAGEQWNGIEKLHNIICDSVDFYIAGHSHLLEDNGPVEECRYVQIVSGGGGATPRAQIAGARSRFSFVGNGFVVLNVRNSNLSILFFSADGTQVYEKKR